MITLHGFGPNLGLQDASVFVYKLDAFLRFNELSFETSNDIMKNLKEAPKGKLPFIKDDGEVIADTCFIIEYLKEKYKLTLDDDLTEEQKATALLFTKALEDNLYWCALYSRWARDETWPLIKDAFFRGLPFPMSKIIPFMARKGILKSLNGHGMGRHSEAEILHIYEQILQSLSTLLGDKEYFFTDKPTSFDITAYAFLAQLIKVNIKDCFTDKAKEFDNLVVFTNKLHKQLYEK